MWRFDGSFVVSLLAALDQTVELLVISDALTLRRDVTLLFCFQFLVILQRRICWFNVEKTMVEAACIAIYIMFRNVLEDIRNVILCLFCSGYILCY